MTEQKQDPERLPPSVAKGAIIVFIVVFLFFFIIIVSLLRSCASSFSAPPTTAPGTTTQPPVVVKTLSLKVTEVTYDEFGYLAITGVLTNTGHESIFSPTIKLKIWNSDESVLLASDMSWAAGTMFENFLPGKSTAISFFTSVSGKPQHVKWLLSCEDADLTIVHTEK